MQIDNTLIEQILVSASWIVPVITGIIQVIKIATNNAIYERWLPALALIIGGILGGLVIGWSVIGILAGVIFGLASSGLFDLGKKTIAGN